MATPERLIATLQAYEQSEALRAAIELDLFTVIARGAHDLPTIAKRCRASTRGVRALANYLVTLGFLERQGASYTLAPDAALFLDKDRPSYLGAAAAFYAAPLLLEGSRSTAGAVRRGGSDPRRVNSMHPHHPVWVQYARGMAPLFRGPATAVAELLEEAGISPTHVLDIAAGHGLFGIEIARRFPGAVVTAVDWPGVLAVARDHARSAGVIDRFHVRRGSAFDVDLGRGYDLVVVANFLHHFAPPTIRSFLRRLRGTMVDGGRIVIVEFVPDDDRVSPPAIARFGLRILTTTPSGDIYTFDEFAGMLHSSGFSGARLYPVARSPERAILAENGPRGPRKRGL